MSFIHEQHVRFYRQQLEVVCGLELDHQPDIPYRVMLFHLDLDFFFVGFVEVQVADLAELR